jgi:hypothetical protein
MVDVGLAKGTPHASVLPYETGRVVVRTFSEAVWWAAESPKVSVREANTTFVQSKART